MSGHDGPDVATGRWRIGTRRASRATLPDETTVDPVQRMLDNAENRVECAKASVDARIARTRQRHLWAGMTQEEMLTAFADALLEVRSALSRGAK